MTQQDLLYPALFASLGMDKSASHLILNIENSDLFISQS